MVGLSAFGSHAQAAFIVTLTQVGDNVVASGSGTIDTAGLTLGSSAKTRSDVLSSMGVLYVGPASSTAIVFWSGQSGPSNFGTGFPLYGSVRVRRLCRHRRF